MKDNVNIQRANEHVIKANCLQYSEQVLVDGKRKKKSFVKDFKG